MAVTRSTATGRGAERRAYASSRAWRTRELAWTLAAATLVAAGLFLVYRAKTAPLPQLRQDIAAKRILNLNALGAREELYPALAAYSDPALREFIARKIYYAGGSLPNVGAIARTRVTSNEVLRGRALQPLRDALRGRDSIPLFTLEQLGQLKPQFVVRSPEQFQHAFWLWTALFFAAFFLAHAFWGLRGFRGDQTFLPAILALTGIGLILMIAMRDPVRDTLLFVDFAQGVVGGSVVLAVASALDFERIFGKLSFVPLAASFILSVLLILFGYGPGVSDAKVNLVGFQPVELIRILLILFLAGYFAKSWDVLRHARETRPALRALTSRVDIPPVEYALPALVCVALSLVFFFLQKDMGPALVFACVFLLLYGIARGSGFVPAAGLLLLACGFSVGYWLGVPSTVRDRVGMWLSPWDNLARGGDQLAHSLWAFATGGIAGTGLGLGDPQLVPAAHTDLVLSAVGEELGWIGFAAVFIIYGWIVYRALRTALRARSDYQLFLATGLAAATGIQILLIAGGTLGVLPLTGVVNPFLSYGRTSMLANFLVIGILLSISSRAEEAESAASAPFRRPVYAAGIVLASLGALMLGKAAYTQLANSAAIMGEGTLVVQADGARRYQYNPRFRAVMDEIPKGTILDRNGLPLATSAWDELEKHRGEFRQIGIDIDRACPRTDARYYPLGAETFDLLGDLRTRDRWGAGNTSFVERDQARRLRGYDDRPTLVEVRNPSTGAMDRVVRYDYRELVPLLRHRYEPNDPEVRRILDRPRDVHMSLDARLQLRVAAILRNQLQSLGKEKGAAVVLDSETGDLLAAVSFPLPRLDPSAVPAPETQQPPQMDRARYGLYPPGSTFKVVTAMAALRKDAALAGKTYQCVRLPEGRVGNYIKGSRRPIRDDVQDKSAHGTVNMERGIVVSCNAYFAQLTTYDVGAGSLFEAANLLGISVASPNTAAQLRESLPQSGYGQGQVVASPFQMARVAATVANGGAMPQGRWVTDENNARVSPPTAVLSAGSAATLARYMREAVVSGTGRRAAGAAVPIAGKTGTAELENAPSHAWFIGFAPYGGASRKIAFSVLVENGIYGGTAAAPAAASIVDAAVQLGLVRP